MNWDKGCRHLHNPNKDTPFVMNYAQALAHLKECKYTLMKCPYGCQAVILEVDLEKHKSVCDFSTNLCNSCELEVMRKDQPSHDCVEALKAMMNNLEKENSEKAVKAQILDELGLGNIPEKRPSCPHNHELRLMRGNPYKRGNVSCDTCKKNFGHSQFNLDKHDFFYHC